MTRYLPILMVALGLFLVSTSFAAARADRAAPSEPGAICLDISAGTQPDADGQKLGRCWKQIGLGFLIAGCTVHAELPPAEPVLEPQPAPCRPPLTDPVLLDGPPPSLDIPPSRA